MRSNAVLIMNHVKRESAIEVRESDGCKGVFAREHIQEDSIIFRLRGTISTYPTKYTIQLGWHRHLNFPPIREANDDTDYCWQYLNHHCEPNGFMDLIGLTFRALRDIEPGEEITFNYLTTESEMAVPFACICGSVNCFGSIQGRDFLTSEQADRLSREMGEDMVVTLLMPRVKKTDVRLKNSQSGQQG